MIAQATHWENGVKKTYLSYIENGIKKEIETTYGKKWRRKGIYRVLC